ncbi:MAG: arginine--tRNA ligase [Ilumatobacter sp.]|jgi:arginyl-tRNA synthetase|uniref:arginine--tRNA ligase n=1 Tax=Ilumatobacter sp. TaxID=1967498 RepID=UPI00391B086F
MSDPISVLNERLHPVFAELAGGEPADPTVRPSDRADAQINGALALAKRVGSNPRELAQRMLDTGILDGIASDSEIAGPGFVNVTFAPDFLAGELARVAGDERLGVAAVDPALTVVVDYSAPNVAKEMHVGHLRSTVIGDCLVRILDFLGHDVIRENHIGDWGRPFGMLIEHLLDLGEDVAAEGLSQGDLDGFYKQANAKFSDDEEFQARSRERVVLLQSGDEETLVLWRRLVEMSNAYFNQVYTKLGVLLTDDDLAGESRYQPLMEGAYQRLDDAGLLHEDDGAMVVTVPGFVNRDGDPLPLIAQSRTGAFMYATSDLACVVDRVERLGADLMLYVIGTPQSQHLQMVFAVCKMAGWLAEPVEAVHVGFGNVLGDDRKILRSRSGDSVKLVDLLDEAIARADAAIQEKNPDMPAATRREVANMVGIGAVKYADLSTDRVKDYVFDFDRMLAFEGNTGPYCQYAHARINRIFDRAGVERASVRGATISIGEPEERSLALQILAFPTAVDVTMESYSPHKLCTYVYELAVAFSSFYDKCPILTSDEPVRTSRLALADLAGRTLARALDLLGIRAPEQM